MKNICFCLIFLTTIIFLSGCMARDFHGAIYTHKTVPLDINLSQTPASGSESIGAIKHFHYYVDVLWDSNAIGEIAKENGIETVYYADLEILKVLGIWGEYTVHVYGK